MRGAGITLVGLLVVAGIIMLMQRLHTVPMLQRGSSAMQDARQLSGQDQSGMRTSESITFAPVQSGTKLKGVQVTSVILGGPMNAHFGLLPGDVVTGVEGLPDLDFLSGGDPETFSAFVLEAYQRRQSLRVDRPGVGEIQLPRDAAVTAPVGQQPYNPFPTTPPADPSASQADPANGTATQTPPAGAAPAAPAAPATPPQRPRTLWDKLESEPVPTH